MPIFFRDARVGFVQPIPDKRLLNAYGAGKKRLPTIVWMLGLDKPEGLSERPAREFSFAWHPIPIK